MREKSSIGGSSWPSEMEIRVGETQDSLLPHSKGLDRWRVVRARATSPPKAPTQAYGWVGSARDG